MRILVIADARIPVPPRWYGGTERNVHLLCAGLRERGHRVDLLAAPESQNYGGRTWAHRPPGASRLSRAARKAWFQLLSYALAKRGVDAVVNVGRLDYLTTLLNWTRLPVVCWFHNPIPQSEADWLRAHRRKNLRLVGISQAQVARLDTPLPVQVIPDAVDADFLGFCADPARPPYVAFLGRLTRNKGVHLAIEAAQRAGVPLKIAGNIAGDEAGAAEYFEREVRPRLGPGCEWIGPVDDAGKRQLLQGAAALLFPTQWEEPFGMVMIESLACGTPVIAWRIAATPEIVLDGVSGYLCDSVEDMVAAIARVQAGALRREDCRREVQERFSQDALAGRFHELLAGLVTAGPVTAPPPTLPMPGSADAPPPRGVRHIPSLDGLRAASIVLVLVAHGVAHLSTGPGPRSVVWTFVDNGHLGVVTFFVISGYLITHLLRREVEGTGRVDLPAFYGRRTLRIFPAFYAFLGTVAVLMACQVLPADWAELGLAGTYTYNYVPLTREFNPSVDLSVFDPRRWYVGHSWTLCLEEQFYLLWPPLLALAGLRRGARIAAGIVLAEPILRVLTHLFFPAARGIVGPMLPWSLDPLMFGALAALWQGHPRFERVAARSLRPWAAAAAVVFLLGVSPWLGARFGGGWNLLFGVSLESAAILLVLLWLVRHPQSRVGRFFNLPLVARVGMLSYSLYLWQQLFLVPWPDGWAVQRFPLNILCVLAAAAASYYCIEKPFLSWKRKFAPSPAAAPGRA